LREALARTDHDFLMTENEPRRPRRSKPRPAARKAGTQRNFRLPAWAAPLARRPMRTICGASFAALLTGIVVNALALQHGPHPAPLFAHVPAEAPRARVPVPPVRPTALAPTALPAEAPVPPLVPLPQVAHAPEPSGAVAAPRSSGDPLGAFIRATTGAGRSDRVAAVQRGLLKLGLAPKDMHIDGMMGATTRQAIERFERRHNLPPTGELSQRTVKLLEADSGLQIP
jgi:hypothetical protein